MSSQLRIPVDGNDKTDYSRWRLKADDNGRHVWHYLRTDEECAAWPQSTFDKYWLGLDTELPSLPPATDILSAARNGFKFYKTLQTPDGHWAGEYGGPMFLIPGLVIASYLAGMPFEDEERFEIIRYLINLAHPEDGGWGLHIEGPSSAFGTALNYVAARLLGAPADHPVMVKARGTLHKLGGAAATPAWGKFWLSVLNVYEWEGNNPIPPELWLLPDWMPIHPHRWWIHTRQVYIPMSYLYGIRYKARETPIVLELREELYTENYYTIDWPKQRNNVCSVDLYVPHTALLNFLNGALSTYEMCALPPLRRKALDCVYRLVCEEDENTSYQDLGPVNKMMNLLVRALVDGPESDAYKMHRLKRKDFMWMGPEGMRMCGTNGSQLWDIAFISQALVESGLAMEEENKEACIKALEWLDKCQIRQNPQHYESSYRHTTKGAWPFSTQEQSYTVSDCTAEGLKAVIYLQQHLPYTPKLVSKERLYDAVDVMLSLQNSDGGFASYEKIRGPAIMEWINPAEVFGNIMIEYNYPECTTSVLTGLSIFKQYYPDYRRNDIEATTRRAVSFLHRTRHKNGCWFGSWGICFTYATMFALESLSLVGEEYENSKIVRRACDFLVSKQKADGGWGESYRACELGEWVDHEETQVVQTAWAVIALIHARYPHREAIERGVKLIMRRQLPDGSWAQEAVEGIFNKTCSIAYPNFKFSFTIWALGKAHKYLAELKSGKANGHQNGYQNGH